MKKLLVILMVLAFAGTVQANVLANPGFEDGYFTGWTTWAWDGGTVSLNSDAYDGFASADFGSVPNWGGGAGAYQGVPMLGGYTVSISAYIKDLSIDGPAGAAGIDMVFYSAVPDESNPDPPNIGRVDLYLDGTSGGPIICGVLEPPAPDANGWAYGYLEAVTPVGTKWMKYEVNNNNNDGQVLFDNVVGIPEPVTIALLGLGGLLLRRRK